MAAAFLLAATRALALDPAVRLTQYGHTAWRVRDGFLPATPLAIGQTSDGFLWIGTEAGLYRFDGVRFERWTPKAGPALPSERIYALLGTRDGSLWIGTGSGLARWRGGRLEVLASAGRFGTILQDRQGTVWAGHTRIVPGVPPLARMVGDRFEFIDSPGLLPLRTVATLHEDCRGELWIGAIEGICRWRSGKPTCDPVPGPVRPTSTAGVVSIASDCSGGLWAATDPSGIWHLSSGEWRQDAEPARPGWDSQVMRVDRRGSLWVGTLGGGLARLTGGRSERMSRADGLSGDSVTELFEDREGNFWVGTVSGLDRFRDIKVVTWTSSEGLPGGDISAVASARSGGVWAAEERTLLRLENGAVSGSWRVGRDLAGSYLTSLFEDSRGRLWFGVDESLRWLEAGRFGGLGAGPGESLGLVVAMAEDRDGSLWAATLNPARALLRIRGDRIVETLSRDRLGGEPVSALVANPEGGVWIGLTNTALVLFKDGKVDFSARGVPAMRGVRGLFLDPRGVWEATAAGLLRFRDGKADVLDTSSGLPCNDIESAETGGDGSLWLKTTCGLVQISSGELDTWSRNPGARIEVRTLDALDGPQAGLASFSPRAARSSDGQLWFAIEFGGLQSFDPGHLDENAIPPPVHVLRVVADRRVYEPAGRIQLKPNTRDIEIQYAALSLAVPEKVRFRYRLDGVDRDWQDVATRREAFFTNLPHGAYRFKVVACNNDGVWNTEGAEVEFTIRPAFYQTAGFLVSCALAIAGAGWWAFRERIRRIRARLDRLFEERLAERTRIARELHDTLLQGFMSASMQLHLVVDRLPGGSEDAGRLRHVLDLMGRVIEEGRNAVRGLRVPFSSEDDLESALTSAARELRIDDKVRIRVVGGGRVLPLRATIRDEVYGIGREALANAIRHARATNIEVDVEFEPTRLRILVRDDGVGIDPGVLQEGREGHWGLSGMRERAERIGGRLRVRGRLGAGTEVELSVPGRIAFGARGSGPWWSWRPWRRSADESKGEIE